MWLPVEVTDLVAPSLKHEANLGTSGYAGGSIGPGKLFVLLDGKTGHRKLLSGGAIAVAAIAGPFHGLFQIGQMLEDARIGSGEAWVNRSIPGK